MKEIIEHEVVVEGNKFVVDIERVEKTFAWIKVIDGAGILKKGTRIRVYIPFLIRKDEMCANTSSGYLPEELLASKIALALYDEILTIRKEILAKRKLRKGVPEKVINLIKKCDHKWEELTKLYPREFWRELLHKLKCVKCGLNATEYKCKTCDIYTPHIYSQLLGDADLQTGDILDVGYLEQWVCTVCLTPRTIRKGGSFARLR